MIYRCKECKRKKVGAPPHSPHLVCAECFPDFFSKYWKEKKLNDAKKERQILEREEKEKDEKRKIIIGVDKEKFQKDINEIARLIDFGQPCTATGKTKGMFHAGHLWARGGNSNIKYQLHNIHIQSAQSNHFQADDVKMREGIKRIYGEEYLNFISELRATPVMKYTNLQYCQFRKIARGIIRRLKKELRIRTSEERIRLRNEINIEIGFYDQCYCIYSQEKLNKTA